MTMLKRNIVDESDLDKGINKASRWSEHGIYFGH